MKAAPASNPIVVPTASLGPDGHDQLVAGEIGQEVRAPAARRNLKGWMQTRKIPSVCRGLVFGEVFFGRQNGDFAGDVISLVAGHDCADATFRLRREMLNRILEILEAG